MASPCQSVRVSIAGHVLLRQGDQTLIDERFRAWLKTPRGQRSERQLNGFNRYAAESKEPPKTRAEVGLSKRRNTLQQLRQKLTGLATFDYHDLIRRCGFCSRESASCRLRIWEKQGVARVADSTRKPYRYAWA